MLPKFRPYSFSGDCSEWCRGTRNGDSIRTYFVHCMKDPNSNGNACFALNSKESRVLKCHSNIRALYCACEVLWEPTGKN